MRCQQKKDTKIDTIITCLHDADSLRTELQKFRDKHTNCRDIEKCPIFQAERDRIYKEFTKRFEYDDSLNTKSFNFGKDKYDALEPFGYFMDKYETPWYDDNIGSFLIVVETSSQ